MKRIYKILFALALVVGIQTSCTDEFLDLTPQQSVSNADFLQAFGDFEAAAIAGYNQMSLADWYGRYMLLIPDIMGEDVKQNASANRAKEWAEYSGSNATLHATEREFWFELYETINVANAMINTDFTPPSGVQTEFNQLIGEAYALRAIAHFDLVRLFGQHYTFTAGATHPGVPIVTEFDATLKPSRNTVGEVYTQVINDFNQAATLMTINENSGRFSREVAQALLSRVYLYMEDWANAEAMASAVINSGRYSLVSNADYATQFLDGDSDEAILEMRFDLVDNPGSNHIGGMYKETGYGDYLPATDLLNLMDPGDVRSTMFLTDPNLGGAFGNIRVDKFPSSGANIATDNVPVIRLSEVYLNRAEARSRMGNDAGAQADLNLVRQRGWPAAAAVTLTGSALTDEILIERRIELAFEGHGIFDITRNQRSVIRDDCTAPVNACTINYPNDRFILALPLDELDANPNITQNPGY